MEKIITYENLRLFAYSNDKICTQPIRGITIHFAGLGNANMHPADMDAGEFYAERGILYVIPYNNPWHWMNRQAAEYTDEIIDVLIRHYGLSENIPIVSSGRSMGGLSCLVYAVYTRRVPVACIANSPVCDAVYHFGEREDLPRTMYSALYHVPGDLETALKTISPIHLVERMPNISYHLFHCGNDTAVDIQKHTEPFYQAMQEYGHKITFDFVPDRKHCDLNYQAKKKYAQYAIAALEAAGNENA